MRWSAMSAVQKAQWLLRCDDELVSFTVSVFLFRVFRARAAAVTAAAAAREQQQGEWWL